MKLILTILLCIAIILAPGCELFTSPKATSKATSEIVVELTRSMVDMVKSGEMTPEQFEAVTSVLNKAKATIDSAAETTGYEFDWTPLVVAGTSILTSITGVNILRNRARRKRGEPTGSTPLEPQGA